MYRELLIAKIGKFTQIINRFWNRLIDRLRYNLERCSDRKNVNRTRSNRHGRYSIRRRICFKVLAFGIVTEEYFSPRQLPIILQPHIFTKRIFKKRLSFPPSLWKLKRTFLSTKLNSITRPIKDEINRVSLLGMHAHVYSHYEASWKKEREHGRFKRLPAGSSAQFRLRNFKVPFDDAR